MDMKLTGYKKRALVALWLPLLWLILLTFELAFIVGREPLPFWARLYEDVVFVMSFLFYNTRGLLGYLERPATQMFIAFALQFFFWWALSFGFLTLKKFFHR